MASLSKRVQITCNIIPSANNSAVPPGSSDSNSEGYHATWAEWQNPNENMNLSERVGDSSHKEDVPAAMQTVLTDATEFASKTGVSADALKLLAKRLGLSITQTKRANKTFDDRLGFGLPKSYRKLFTTETPPRTLFKFGGQPDGLFFASEAPVLW